MRLFFPPFPQTLEIDVADFHITTATETTGMNIPKRSCRQALRFAPSGLRSGHASNNDKRKERNKFQQLSGIMVVADRKEGLTPDSFSITARHQRPATAERVDLPRLLEPARTVRPSTTWRKTARGAFASGTGAYREA